MQIDNEARRRLNLPLRPDHSFWDGLGVALVLSFAFVWAPVLVGLYLRCR